MMGLSPDTSVCSATTVSIKLICVLRRLDDVFVGHLRVNLPRILMISLLQVPSTPCSEDVSDQLTLCLTENQCIVSLHKHTQGIDLDYI